MQPRVKIQDRAPGERVRDFKEVNAGYTLQEALREAGRCLQCKDRPCVEGCPLHVDIPAFIRELTANRIAEAVRVLREKNSLPAICGRVCPQEEQCGKLCALGRQGEPVAIGCLERFVADWEKANADNPGTVPAKDILDPRVAVVGSGPAGLACAGEMAHMKFSVTIFESLHDTGGVLRYGIPAFRLPKEILDFEVDNLRRLGVRIVTNVLIGRTKCIEDLFAEGFDAVFLGVGTGPPQFMRLPGENLNNIFSAGKFLARVSKMGGNRLSGPDVSAPVGKKVAVIGGGDAAMDSARAALRTGAEEVTLIYRGSRQEMQARSEEIRHAEEEGIRFVVFADPVAYQGDDKGFVKEMECRKMEPGEPDETGTLNPRPVPGSRFVLPVDMVVVAVGLAPNPLVPSLATGLKTHLRGELVVNEDFLTTRCGVFAGGGIIGGETVIQAMGMGKGAAQAIEAFLFNKRMEC